MNGICPFRADPHKKAFHLDLMAAGLLHASVLKAGDELVGALLGIEGRDGVSVGVYAYSPTQSRHSPGKFLLLMLALELAAAGMKQLDLTPGGEWKERFANAHDEVAQVTLYFGASGAHRRRAEETLLAGGRKLLALAGLTPDDAREKVGKWKRRVADIAALPQRLTDRTAVLIYFRDVAPTADDGAAVALRRDVIGDLLLYEPHSSGPGQQAFLSDSLYRLTDGQQLRTLIEDGRLVHHAWLVHPAKTQEYREVGQRYRFPDDTLLIADWGTADSSTRATALRATVQAAVEAARVVSAKRIAVALAEDDNDARSFVEQLGFELHERLVRAGRPGES